MKRRWRWLWGRLQPVRLSLECEHLGRTLRGDSAASLRELAAILGRNDWDEMRRYYYTRSELGERYR